MTAVSTAQVAFNAGILSRNLEARIDQTKYSSSCREMSNFFPLIAGPAKKRSGTRFVQEVKTSSLFTRLVSFEFSTTQAYILEFGNQYMRVYANNGIVLTTGPAIFEVATPFLTADLDSIYFAQSADVLYAAHPSYAPTKISRTADDAWTVETITFDWPPFNPENFDVTVGMAASADTGTGITLTSSGGVFTADMVGGYIRLREIISANHPQWVELSSFSNYFGSEMTVGQRCYNEGNVYELVEKIDLGGGPFSQTGTEAPTQDEGTQSDGKWVWKYINSGAGYVLITAVTDAFRATGTVVHSLPESTTYADGTITNITQANPAVVTQTAHGLRTGDRVYIQDVVGMTEVNQRSFIVTKVNANSYSLDDEDSSAYTAYSSGGIAIKITNRFSIGAWSDEFGYPRCVAFYEDRLVWAGSSNNPQTYWFSRTGDYENHRESDQDDSAIVTTLNTDQVNVIEWISSSEELATGTAGGEFNVQASTVSEVLTPGNIRAVRIGTRGSKAGVEPIRVGQQVLFVQRSGRKLLELVFDFNTDGFEAVDLTVLADTVVEPGIRAMAFQKEPHRIIWAVLDDGQLIGISYEREQQVIALHVHPLGGTDVSVESVAVIPHPDGDQDQVWVSVARTVDGSTVRYVEFIEKDWLETYAQVDAFFVDSGLTYDSADQPITGITKANPAVVTQVAHGLTTGDRVYIQDVVGMTEVNDREFVVTVLTVDTYELDGEDSSAHTAYSSGGITLRYDIAGLDHLEGETVSVLADGKVHSQLVVTSGVITLDYPAAKVQAGLPYQADVLTSRLEVGTPNGIAQGKIQRVHSCIYRLYQTGGSIKYGTSLDELDVHAFRDIEDLVDAAIPLFDGDTERLTMPGEYEQAARVALRHDDPLPCTLLGVFPQVQAQDGG